MGLHLIPNNLSIDFVGLRKVSYIVSLLLILAGVASLAVKGGPRYGIDFSGGATVQIKFATPVSDEQLKASLAGSRLPGLVVQQYGNDGRDYILRISAMQETSTDISQIVNEALAANLKGVAYTIPRLDMVGPKVGADLRSQALEAMYYAILLIAIYVSGRFEYRWLAAAVMAAALAGAIYGLGLLHIDKVYLVFAAVLLTIVLCWRLKLTFAMGAIVSILHDVLITVGIFSLLNKEFDLTIIAALLTIVGYSLNDTIIVYDRIRENLRGDFVTPLPVIINRSINQTLSRTVLTSGTTLLVIGALLIFGGGMIFDFALVMFIGVFVGTASSMFVASPILIAFGDNLDRTDHTRKDKRPRDADGRLAAQV